MTRKMWCGAVIWTPFSMPGFWGLLPVSFLLSLHSNTVTAPVAEPAAQSVVRQPTADKQNARFR